MLVTRESFTDFERALAESIARGESPCVDTETTGLDPWGTRHKPGDTAVGIAVGIPGAEYYAPIAHAYGLNLDPGQAARLVGLLGQAECLVNWNIKFDLHSLRKMGLPRPKRVIDGMLLAALVDENRSVALKECADRYLGSGSEESGDLNRTLALWGLSKAEMWRLPASAVEPYACQDVRLPVKLIEKLSGAVDAETRAVWEELNEFSMTVYDAEHAGVHVDAGIVATLTAECYANMQRLERELKSVFGPGFNPSSPKVVAARMGLRDATEASVTASKHPYAPMVIEYRSWQKAATTYFNKYMEVMDASGNVHTNFRITGTVTSRLSSSNPNMQAVPTWSLQQRVKEAFTPRGGGRVLAELDYSQAEIRVAAHYTRDEHLVEAVKSGKDIHQQTADLTGLTRQAAKTLNFSVVYGIGAASLAPNLGVSEKEAWEFLQKYHDVYPGFREVSRTAERIARDRQYIKMYTGRRRHFNHPDAETRKAFSNLIQGGVGEMVRRAMVRAHPLVVGAAGFIVNQVHDSLWLDIPEEGSEELVREVRKQMEDQPQFSVPILVDAKIGKNMHDMKKVER